MAVNPLIVFAGLSVATLGSLVVVTQQNKKPPSQPPVVTQKQPLALVEPSVDAAKVEIKKPVSKLANLSTAKKSLTDVSPAKAPPSPISQKPDAKTARSGIAPTFDIVRVEEDGGAVVVGKAAPNAEVALKLNGKTIGQAKANKQGDWIFVPDQLMPKGSHELIVEATDQNNKTVRSEQSIIISMPDNAKDKPLIVVSKAGAPSRVLQKPKDAPAKTIKTATLPKPAVAAETVIKKAPPAPAPVAKKETIIKKVAKLAPVKKVLKKDPKKIKLTFGTVDYNDDGDIVFSGTAQSGKTIRLYVDNKFVGDAQVNKENSWIFRGRENIKPGSHELRADQVDGSGRVAQRTAVPFIRANPTKVAALLKTRKKEPKAEKSVTTNKIVETLPVTNPVAKNAPEVQTPVALSQPAKPQTTKSPEIKKLAAKQSDEPVITKQEPQNLVESKTVKTKLVSHVVIQPGNNLWNISRVIYGKGVAYTTIFQANKKQINNPHKIYPGQIFTTPGVTSTGSIEPDQRDPLKNAAVEN